MQFCHVFALQPAGQMELKTPVAAVLSKLNLGALHGAGRVRGSGKTLLARADALAGAHLYKGAFGQAASARSGRAKSRPYARHLDCA